MTSYIIFQSDLKKNTNHMSFISKTLQMTMIKGKTVKFKNEKASKPCTTVLTTSYFKTLHRFTKTPFI